MIRIALSPWLIQGVAAATTDSAPEIYIAQEKNTAAFPMNHCKVLQ